MRRIALALAIVTPLVLSASAARAGCNDPDLETVRDEISPPARAPEPRAARELRRARRQGRGHERQARRNCKEGRRCAARSTCGKKEGFVTCTICVPGTCTEGFLRRRHDRVHRQHDVPQVVDRCSTKSDALSARPGWHRGEGSCCHATCLPPG
jgi:hypothetical protein